MHSKRRRRYMDIPFISYYRRTYFNHSRTLYPSISLSLLFFATRTTLLETQYTKMYERGRSWMYIYMYLTGC